MDTKTSESIRKVSANAREEIRSSIQAFGSLVVQEGSIPVKDISDQLEVLGGALRRWVAEYEADGEGGLPFLLDDINARENS